MQTFVQTTIEEQPKKKKGRFPRVSASRFWLGTTLVLLILLSYLVLGPLGLGSALKLKFLMFKVSRQTPINMWMQPQFAIVAKADSLKSNQGVMAEVYKDVLDGDKILVFSDKMVIYRESTDKIVYEGKTPKQLNDELTDKIVLNMIEKIKEAKIIPADDVEKPQVSIVSDPVSTRQRDPNFYAKVEKNDLIALFPNAGRIVLYRTNGSQIVNFGLIKTVIQSASAQQPQASQAPVVTTEETAQ